jgi:signal transduction histidine kinase
MTDAHVLVSVVEVAVGVACLVIVAFAWPHRTRPAGTPLVALAVTAAGWAFTAAVASLVGDAGVTRAAQFATYVAGGASAVAWFYVVVEYTGRDDWTRPAVQTGVLGLVVLDVASVATNAQHHLYLTAASRVTPAGLFDPTPGPLLWAHAAWKAGLILLGVGMLVRQDVRREGVVGLQLLAVLVTGLLPMAAAVLELLDLVVVPGLDFGVVGVAAGSALVLWALFYADFLDVVPIARATLLASMRDAVVAVDTDGRVVDMNRQARALFGVGSEAVGASAATALARYPELFGDGTTLRSGPIEITAEVDGESRDYEFEASPIRERATRSAPWGTSSSECVGRLLTFRDVTLRKRHERSVERKNARLEEFASVVSHDLRNPLNVAQGRVELASDARETGDEHLATAERALDRMETLIEELLMLAREGKAVEDAEPVDLGAVAESCWRSVVTGEATLVVESDRRIRADRTRLQALFENLFRNAVEHGGSDVTITVGDLESGAGFFVADDGVGIPDADRERVFESGYSTARGGSGLGLAIVSVVAEGHGWTVEVGESEGGARFEFAGVDPAD